MTKSSSAPTDKTAIELGGQFDCHTARQFLELLNPMHSIWHPTPALWVYRGISDTKHKLQAKAHRPGAFAQLSLGGDPEHVMQHILDRFRNALDRAGLVVPALAPEPEPVNGRVWYGFLERTDLPLMALAQHLGLPTPLLDWSLQARVAAYFAAEPATKRGGKRGRLAVWAIRRDLQDFYVKTGFIEGTEQETHAALTFETAPRATNPNLHAQSGVFTWLHGEKEHTLTIDEYVKLVADQYSKKLKEKGIFRPLLRRITAPRACAGEILQLLRYQGVDGASMFPGYDGVVRGLLEGGF